MTKIRYIIYTSIPFFILSLNSIMLIYKNTPPSGIFDMSGVGVVIGLFLNGIILLIANMIIFNRLDKKDIIDEIPINLIVTYSISYILILLFSFIAIEPIYSYELAFMMPIIMLFITIFINYITDIEIDVEFSEGKKPIFFFIVFIIILINSLFNYYSGCILGKKWAYEHWSIAQENYYVVKGIDSDKYCHVIGSERLDTIESINIEEKYYYKTPIEGEKIYEYLIGMDTINKLSTAIDGIRGQHYYKIVYQLAKTDNPDYSPLTEDILNKIDPVMKNITVNDSISYSKLVGVLQQNGYTIITHSDYLKGCYSNAFSKRDLN